ncbi:unnamed protein product [Lactuca virosa]|uniref:Protein kinase domain-containing protein n=1 Tax=Lactuca virosa TaxID=75947 RepID=A0AAU9PGR3_9ASTR|nr:unnamed protein product [Lactuca virosa]
MSDAPINRLKALLLLGKQTCQRFTLSEIQLATNNFDDTLVIGRGGFGNVYKCRMKIGLVSEVAVKRLHSMSTQGAHEFEAEVKVLSKLGHDGRVRSKSVMSDVAVRSKFVIPDVTGGSNSVISGVAVESKSLMSGVAVGSKSVKQDDKVLSKSDFSAQNIPKSTTGSIRIFTYDELVSATNDFKDMERSPTSYGSIYKGWVDEKSYAPTKCGVGLAIYVRKEEILTWKNPLDFHLTDWIHVNYFDAAPDRTPLSWAARLKIAQGAAKGLSFFHQRNHPAYNSFDGNHILVDRVMYTAFDLLAFCMEKTIYLPQLAALLSKETNWMVFLDLCPGDESGVQSEIYAFGVVLLKMLTGMKKYDERIPLQQKNLMEWATPLLANEVNLGMIMDPQLQHNDHPPKGAFQLAQLVLKCLQPTRGKNLSIEEISQALYQCYKKEITSV